MSELLELAARCEAAEGPSRELDIAIALAQPEKFFNAGPRYDGADDRIGKRQPDGDMIPGNDPAMLVPRYTASIDAALTLVPDGLWWSVNNDCQAIILTPKMSSRDLCTDAATPALALCAAALKDRATFPLPLAPDVMDEGGD